MDLKAGTFHHVPSCRVDALEQLLDIIIAKDLRVSMRTLSCMTGSLVSVSCYGSICASLDKSSNVQRHLSSPLLVSADMFGFWQSLGDAFWKQNFNNSRYLI